MNAPAATTRRQTLAEYPQRMRTAQAAEYLSCSEDLIVRLCKSGELPAINVALPGAKRAYYRITRADVAAFEQARKY